MCHGQDMASPWAQASQQRGRRGGPPSSWVMQFAQGPLAKVSRSVCPSPCVCHCHCRVVVTALLVLSMNSSRVVSRTHCFLSWPSPTWVSWLEFDLLAMCTWQFQCGHDEAHHDAMAERCLQCQHYDLFSGFCPWRCVWRLDGRSWHCACSRMSSGWWNWS